MNCHVYLGGCAILLAPIGAVVGGDGSWEEKGGLLAPGGGGRLAKPGAGHAYKYQHPAHVILLIYIYSYTWQRKLLEEGSGFLLR